MILNVATGVAPSAQPQKSKLYMSRDILTLIREMTLPTMLVKCFEYFSKFEPIISDFEASKSLLDLLASIVTALDNADAKKGALSTKLSDYASRLLFTRDWPSNIKVSSDAVVSILETNVKFASDSVQTLTNITKELTIKSDSPVRKSHSHMYFKASLRQD